MTNFFDLPSEIQSLILDLAEQMRRSDAVALIDSELEDNLALGLEAGNALHDYTNMIVGNDALVHYVYTADL